MQAAVINEHGPPECIRFEERPVPEPGAGQVLIRVRATAINHLDLWVRKGVDGHHFPLPMIPGCDFAGVVERVGDGAFGVQPGDRVVANPGFSCGHCARCRAGRHNLCRSYGIFGETCDGGCAQYAVIPSRNCMPIPERLDFAQAAAVPLAFLTAWGMLVDRCRVQPGQDVLVHAGGSGVSSAAIQIAKLFNARVLTTAGSEEKCRKAKELGADVAINYREQRFPKLVREHTGGKGADIIVDHVGGDTWNDNFKCVAWGGTITLCGATTNPVVRTDLRHVFFKSISILGSTMGGMGALDHVMKFVDQGRFEPVVDRCFPLEDIVAAHRYVENRENFGKVVLTQT